MVEVGHPLDLCAGIVNREPNDADPTLWLGQQLCHDRRPRLGLSQRRPALVGVAAATAPAGSDGDPRNKHERSPVTTGNARFSALTHVTPLLDDAPTMASERHVMLDVGV